MEEKLTESEMQFLGFISMMANTALYQMGKVGHPVTGKTEKDLNAAQMTIELLQMIQDKTKGNLSKSEESVLNDYLTHLRLNYVEEIEEEKKKPAVPKEEKKEEKK